MSAAVEKVTSSSSASSGITTAGCTRDTWHSCLSLQTGVGQGYCFPFGAFTGMAIREWVIQGGGSWDFIQILWDLDSSRDKIVVKFGSSSCIMRPREDGEEGGVAHHAGALILLRCTLRQIEILRDNIVVFVSTSVSAE